MQRHPIKYPGVIYRWAERIGGLALKKSSTFASRAMER